MVAPGRVLPTVAMGVFGSDRIHFALDGHHPFGACHHQKIVVADDLFAFCGGIDTTEDRWDTSEHMPNDPRRLRKDGSPAPPWHDVTSALTGPAASALGELARRRWRRATGDQLDRPGDRTELPWPAGLEIVARNLNIAIARTEPPFEGESLVNEIERLCLDQIAAARNSIYIESQYFAAESICQALEARLREPDGPEIVVVNPQAALSSLEDEAMHVLRGRLISRMDAADRGDRFRILYPVTRAGEPIYIHAKVFIIDDRVLRIGSSNLNDRSMGFDTECDIAFESPNDDFDVIEQFRTRLLAEHLGVEPSRVENALSRTGSLIDTIDALNDERRGFRAISRKSESRLGGWFADSRVFDPRYHPGEVSNAGEGLRPRHIAMIGAAAGVGIMGWFIWRRWFRNPVRPQEKPSKRVFGKSLIDRHPSWPAFRP